MSPRLEQSAALRLAIWQWLTDHPGARMQDIWAAFPDQNRETIRKNVQNMRKSFNLGVVSCRGRDCHYVATAIAPKTAAQSRERLRTGVTSAAAKAASAAARAARRNARIVQARRRENEALEAQRLAAIQAEDEAAAKQARDEPWRYIHTPGQYKPQGGQGAIRPKVFVNCRQNY